jgi:NAD(P)-dependent dehydrogenase (short-subunit alcohol dehydrogenase family)
MSNEPAHEVAEEIRAAGGEAVANADDVSDWEGAERLVTLALTTFGRLDVLVNNAGVLRDRMLVNMALEDWDQVIRVHLGARSVPLATQPSTGGTSPRPARRWMPV